MKDFELEQFIKYVHDIKMSDLHNLIIIRRSVRKSGSSNVLGYFIYMTKQPSNSCQQKFILYLHVLKCWLINSSYHSEYVMTAQDNTGKCECTIMFVNIHVDPVITCIAMHRCRRNGK
jgi:hypothetical protein